MAIAAATSKPRGHAAKAATAGARNLTLERAISAAARAATPAAANSTDRPAPTVASTRVPEDEAMTQVDEGESKYDKPGAATATPMADESESDSSVIVTARPPPKAGDKKDDKEDDPFARIAAYNNQSPQRQSPSDSDADFAAALELSDRLNGDNNWSADGARTSKPRNKPRTKGKAAKRRADEADDEDQSMAEDRAQYPKPGGGAASASTSPQSDAGNTQARKRQRFDDEELYKELFGDSGQGHAVTQRLPQSDIPPGGILAALNDEDDDEKDAKDAKEDSTNPRQSHQSIGSDQKAVNASLTNLTQKLIVTTKLQSHTTLHFNCTVPRSRAPYATGASAITAVLRLLKEYAGLKESDEKSMSNTIADATTTPTQERPTKAQTGGFNFPVGSKESWVNLRVRIEFKPHPTRTPFTRQRLPSTYDPLYSATTFTVGEAASRITADLKARAANLIPESPHLQMVEELLTKWGPACHGITRGTEPLAATAVSTIGPDSVQADLERLIADCYRPAYVYTFVVNGRCQPTALVLTLARYAAGTHKQAGSGVKVTIGQSDAVDASTLKLATACNGRVSVETALHLALNALSPKAAFEVRRYVRPRVCCNCFAGSHSATQCTAQRRCGACGSVECEDECISTVKKCPYCAGKHHIRACPKYNGAFQHTEDIPYDYKPAPATHSGLPNIRGTCRLIGRAKSMAEGINDAWKNHYNDAADAGANPSCGRGDRKEENAYDLNTTDANDWKDPLTGHCFRWCPTYPSAELRAKANETITTYTATGKRSETVPTTRAVAAEQAIEWIRRNETEAKGVAVDVYHRQCTALVEQRQDKIMPQKLLQLERERIEIAPFFDTLVGNRKGQIADANRLFTTVEEQLTPARELLRGSRANGTSPDVKDENENAEPPDRPPRKPLNPNTIPHHLQTQHRPGPPKRSGGPTAGGGRQARNTKLPPDDHG
jgi:hypothetical protein